jgi:O-antigen ligase
VKWIAILAWASMCPIVMAHLRRTPAHLIWAAFAMGLIPFITGSFHLYVAPMAWPLWAGWPKGLEVSILDFLAIAVLAATRSPSTRLRLLWPWLAYLAAVAIALPQANVKMAGFFYVWQLLRMILIAVAAMRLATYPGAADWLFKGIFAGVAFQVFFAISQVAGGAEQAGGAFGAQNLLGIMAHFALFPAFAMLLAGKRGAWPIIGFASAAIVDLLTASRATLGLAAIGIGLLSILSLYKSFTTRKIIVVGVGAFLVAAATPFALKSISDRQAGNSVESSNFQRNAMKQAAWMIIADYPLGTGPSQYVVIANVGGYAARAGVAWQPGMRGTAVHNSYLLILAETSVLGLITMILVLAWPVLIAWRAARRFKNEPQSELLLGIAVAGTILIAHLYYEWAFVLFLFQYTFAMVSGVVIGLAASFAAKRRASIRRAAKPIPEVEATVFSPAR